MTESEGTSEGRRPEPPGQDGAPAEGGATPQGDWRERAAFHVSIHSSADADGRIVWQTQAYHEERDAAMSWPGAPGEALIHWLIAVAELPTDPAPQPTAHEAPAPAPLAEETPVAKETPGAEAAPEQADDFTQIIGIGAAAERQLHGAGIRTYAQLAASAPAEIAALLNIPPERVTRRGWITRARALARLASLPGPPPIAQAEPEAEAQPAQANTALLIEVHLDPSGDILETRLLREHEPASPAPGPDEGHIASLFVEQAAQPDGAPALGSPEGPPIEVEVELDDLELEELPGPLATGAPLMRARSSLRLAGLGAEQVLRRRPGYLAYLLAYDLETGATRLLQGTGGQLEVRQEPLELTFGLPEIGRYQTVLVAALADGSTLSATAGPRLRVNP